MKGLKFPGTGCFKASYPINAWQPVPCTVAPHIRYQPMSPVGNRTDFVANPAHPIVSVTGSFDSVVGTTAGNTFSVQLNGNSFPTSMCLGHPGCVGAQQVILFNWSSVAANNAAAFFQYWLLGFGPVCPQGGWDSDGMGSCNNNSPAVAVPYLQSVADLANLTMTGAVGAQDSVIVSSGPTSTPGDIFAVNTGSVLQYQGHWNSAEFGVFGDGGGSMLTFNPGSALVARMLVDDGAADSPSCGHGGFTVETNSLSLVSCCPSLSSPAVVITENNTGAAAPCTCPPGATFNATSNTCVCSVPGQVVVNGACGVCGGASQQCCNGDHCGAGLGCDPATRTCKPCPSPAPPPHAVIAQNFHLGSDCGGTTIQRIVAPAGGMCSPNARRFDCIATLTSLANDSAGTTQWTDQNNDRSCSCLATLHTPADCSKWADFTVTVRETMDPIGCP